MGNLASYLQSSFQKHCPSGWRVDLESHPVPQFVERFLGYAPRADLLLAHKNGRRNLWIELEISRADPVANHAKFATAHLFSPFPKTDTFVSMVSSHVDRGRRNLAARTILLLRHIGLNAYQIPLLPAFSPEKIKELNQSSLTSLATSAFDVRAEIQRAILLTQPFREKNSQQILYTTSTAEVLSNLESWNHQVLTPEGHRLWGKRSCKYFVFNPFTKNFAPAKFCAFVEAKTTSPTLTNSMPEPIYSLTEAFMPMHVYAALDEEESRFDGHIAWQHLVRNLRFAKHSANSHPQVAPLFAKWMARFTHALSAPQKNTFILIAED
jgi:hypothetical protein